MRKQFVLPEQDEDFLLANSFEWEAIKDGRFNWVIISNYPVPEGYTIDKVNVALRIDPGYPVAQIDMAYFYPDLHLVSGKAIPAIQARQIIEGKNWQRWSRHRTGHNPWRPGLDDISTHLHMVTTWLEREVKK